MNTTTKTGIMITMAMAIAGCGAATPSQEASRLEAGAGAKAYGISAYALRPDGAALLDARGEAMGAFTISAPDETTRLVRFEMSDGSGCDNELVRPTARGFEIAMSNRLVFDAVQLDPPLAPLFASFQIRYAERTGSVHGAGELQPAEFATCLHANTGAGCYDLTSYPQYYCVTDTSERDTNEIDMMPAGTCDFYCTGGGYYFDYSTPTQGAPGYDDCFCYRYVTSITNYVSCPRVSCTTSGQRDMVARRRYCFDPGSCNNQSYYYSCTTL